MGYTAVRLCLVAEGQHLADGTARLTKDERVQYHERRVLGV